MLMDPSDSQPPGDGEPPGDGKKPGDGSKPGDREKPPPADDPDLDIIRLVVHGKRGEALKLLMARHGRSVYSYCRDALHDPTLADDVHQQVFIQVHRDLPRFAARSKLRTWLFAIARNRVLDAAKARKRAGAHIEDRVAPDTADPAPPPGQRLDDAALLQALSDCVQALPEPTRTAVLLHYQQRFTFEEMAEICGEKAGTLQARVTRALPILRKCVEERTGLRL
jgi:RNA polymerase sigma-70 factor, ECF subfamily